MNYIYDCNMNACIALDTTENQSGFDFYLSRSLRVKFDCAVGLYKTHFCQSLM